MAEAVEVFVSTFEYAQMLRGYVLRRRAEEYATSIQDANAALDKRVCSIGSTIIRMCQPDKQNSFQETGHIDHRRARFHFYQWGTTSDGPIFSHFEPI